MLQIGFPKTDDQADDHEGKADDEGDQHMGAEERTQQPVNAIPVPRIQRRADKLKAENTRPIRVISTPNTILLLIPEPHRKMWLPINVF